MKYFLKKNIGGIILMLVFFLIPVFYFLLISNDYQIDSSDCKTLGNEVIVNVLDDGSMTITEKMHLKTRWHEINKDIVYGADKDNPIQDNDNNGQQFQNPSFNSDVVRVRVLNKDGNEIFATDNTNIGFPEKDNMIQFSFAGGFTHTWYDDPSHSVSSSYANAERIYIYAKDGLGPECYIEYTYGFKGAVMYYEDIAELNAIFATNNEMVTNDVNVTINLPKNSFGSLTDEEKEKFKVFGHGTDGKVEILNDYTIKLSAKKLLPNDNIEARILMPNKLFDVTKFDNDFNHNVSTLSHYENAIKYEEKLRKETNTVNTLETVSLVVIILSILYTIGLFILLYVKYDKEYKPEFFGEYYRELPNDYGPAVMGYLYRFKDADKNDVTATLLDLIRRKHIILNADGESLTSKKPNYIMTLNKEKPTDDLKDYEKTLIHWFFEVVGDGDKVSLDQLDAFNGKEKTALIYQKCNRDFNLQVEKEGKKYNFFEAKKGVKACAAFGVILFIALIFHVCASLLLFGLISPVYGIWWTIGLLVFIFWYANTIIRRTKSGNEEYVKWKAFEKFLKEFSNIKDYPMPGIIVWEHYMVYAAEFGIADLVEKQVRFKYSELGREGELTQSSDNSFFAYPTFYHYYCYRVSYSSVIANNTIMKARAARASSSSRGGGGFGGGSSHGMGGTHMSGR